MRILQTVNIQEAANQWVRDQVWGKSMSTAVEDNLKAQYPSRKTCNNLGVWSLKLGGGLLGWATFPEYCKSSPTAAAKDGVVVDMGTFAGVNYNTIP